MSAAAGTLSGANSKGDDLILQIMVLRTLFPDVMRQAIKDELAEAGFTLGELPGLLKKTMQLATEH